MIYIKHAKFSYISMEFQLLPCAPACGYKFHTLAVYLHQRFTAPFQSEAYLESSQRSAVELFAEIVDVFRPLAVFGEELHRGCLTRFSMRLIIARRRSGEKSSITGEFWNIQGNLGLTLPAKFS